MAPCNSKNSSVNCISDVERDRVEDREQWNSKTEFLLSCIGLSVGIGNVWRFPYLAYKNGGGAFLLAYTIMLILVGKPQFFAELAIGQFAGVGTLRIWRCLPIAKGVGVGMTIMSSMIAVYYNVIMTYTLYYMAQSFRSEVPWSNCKAWWGADDNCYLRLNNTRTCWEVPNMLAEMYSFSNQSSFPPDLETKTFVANHQNVTVPLDEYDKAFRNCSNGTQTASEQFWEKYVLQLTSGIDDLGVVKWDLAICLFVCWMVVFFGLVKGIQSSGKVVYFTATFPYVILITLVIYGCTLPGASAGLKYFFVPDWHKLTEIEIWRAATEQLVFSLSLGSGCLTMYGSYNKFDNKLYKDAVFVSALDFVTSLMAGLVIFTVLGHLSDEMGIHISKVVTGGQGLAFVTYPEALARLPIPQLWSVMFFFMLFLLAVDSEFSYMENLFTVIFDEFPSLKRRKAIIVFTTCMLFFLLGLPCVTQGGQYVLNLMDTYGGGYGGIFIAAIEMIALMWGYGVDRFSSDLEFMLGFKPGLYWRICWRFITPVALLCVLVYSFINHEVIKYGGVEYPMWAEQIGWLLIMVSVLQVPLWMLIQIYKHKNDLWKLIQPHPDWGPLDPEIRRQYQMQRTDRFKINKPSTNGVDNPAMEMETRDS